MAVGCASSSGLNVKEIGSMHVGGREVVLSGLPVKELRYSPTAPAIKSDPNGEFETGQMYVRYVRLAAPKAKYPLLLWHGGGMTGVNYETKPDGGEGWQMAFLKAGHDVYVSDAVERGRASWNRYPEIYSTEPFFRSKKEAWELFRMGPAWDHDPAKRSTFEGTQFPVASFDQFFKQFVPRWTTNEVATQAAYDSLVQKVCPCVIVVHSQGSIFGFEAARRAPDKVKAVIAVEPITGPDPAKIDLAGLKTVPHLFVMGDNLDKSPTWQTILPAVNRYADALRKQGTPVEVMDLPKLGIRGNSHMIMMDRNSDQIADLIQKWMAKEGLMK
jgi:pimeloyl-ACP methyl ester carboxylesterase